MGQIESGSDRRRAMRVPVRGMTTTEITDDLAGTMDRVIAAHLILGLLDGAIAPALTA